MTVIMVVVSPLQANAREKPTEEINLLEVPESGTRYVDVSSLKASFGISSTGKASIFGNIVARSAEKTQVTCKLKRYRNGNWETYKSWTQLENDRVSTVILDYYVPQGYFYRLDVYGYAWVNGVLVDTPVYITGTEYY